jgi:hypothetical protein
LPWSCKICEEGTKSPLYVDLWWFALCWGHYRYSINCVEGWTWGYMSVIPAMREAEIGG